MRMCVPPSTDALHLWGLLIRTEAHYLPLRSSHNKKHWWQWFNQLQKNTHADKQSGEKLISSAFPPFRFLPPSAIPGCLPAADNGCAPLRALNRDDGWGHSPHSRPRLLHPHASICSPLERINGKFATRGELRSEKTITQCVCVCVCKEDLEQREP